MIFPGLVRTSYTVWIARSVRLRIKQVIQEAHASAWLDVALLDATQKTIRNHVGVHLVFMATKHKDWLLGGKTMGKGGKNHVFLVEDRAKKIWKHVQPCEKPFV